MMASLRAELLRLLRWPTTWILSGVWLLLNVAFGYVFNYLSYRSNVGGGVSERAAAAGLLAQMMPDQAPVTMTQGMPMFGGALVMILGAVAVGSGYGWGTWKTIFTTGPRRTNALAGTLGAVAVIVIGLMVATLALDLATSLVFTLILSQPLTWPSLLAVLEGLGSALLIAAMWAAAGVFLGTLTRGPALAVGLGLVWSLVVENLLRGVAALLGPLHNITDVLPGTAAGSLAAALGAATQNTTNGTPGVTDAITGATATVLLFAYLAVFIVATTLLTVRRDVTS